jgi:hypothetical protein
MLGAVSLYASFLRWIFGAFKNARGRLGEKERRREGEE